GLAPAEARGRAHLEIEYLAQRLLGAARILLRGVGRHAHDLVLVLAELHAEGQSDEGVEGAQGAGRGRRRFVAREGGTRTRGGAAPRGGGGAEPVARVVVGEDEGLASREARAEIGRSGVATVVIEAHDTLARDAEMLGDEGETLGLTDAELPPRGVDQAELGSPLPHLLLEGPARRGPGDTVVLLRVGLFVEHAIEPLARGRPCARPRHEIDLAGTDA